jgi:two-component system, OmpR family, KDP operon response regulator KdpE
MNPSRILIASSNAEQRAELRAALEFEGYDLAEVATAMQAVQQACTEHYDVLVTDSVADGIGAHSLCQKIRPQSKLGIIIWGGTLGTTAIDSLNAGADDFIPAPFVMAEMLARVRAILRRVSGFDDHRAIVLQDREVDLKSYEIKGPGSQVAHLTPKEFLVLQYLITHANQPRTTQALAQTIWQRDGKGELEYVRIVIRQLRRKLEPDPGKPRYLLSERPEGYRFKMPSVQARCYRAEGRPEGARQWARLA